MQTLTVLYIAFAVLAIRMSVRSIQSYSGTARLRLTNGQSVDVQHDTADHKLKYKDDAGTVQSVVTEGLGFANAVVSATAATLTLAPATHSEKTVVLNRAAGIAVTLPAATGSGARYRLVVGIALSAASHTIAVASGTDYMRGVSLTAADDASGSAKAWATADTGTVATESDTITLDGSTKSGYPGTIIELEDIASAVWSVNIRGKATGAEATPFSAAV